MAQSLQPTSVGDVPLALEDNHGNFVVGVTVNDDVPGADITQSKEMGPNSGEMKALPMVQDGEVKQAEPSAGGGRASRASTETSVYGPTGSRTWQISMDTLKAHKKADEVIIKHKSAKVRHFYKRQNDVIDNLLAWYDSVEKGGGEDSDDNRLYVRMLIYASFMANVCLVVIKVIAAALSGSLAVIASTIDSFLDILSGAILFTASKLARKRDIRKYPQGKTRFEPISIIIFASFMGMAALQIIISSIQDILSRVSSNDYKLTIDRTTWGILGAVIGTKLILWLLCRTVRKDSPSVDALAQDHFNDVVSNSLSLVAVGLASNYKVVWWLDPAFAMAFSVFIIIVWMNTGKEQIQKLAGITADNEMLNLLTLMAYNHHKRIVKIDTVRAYYFGNRLLVEVDIVLPEDMPMKEAHDIGESLQNAIEKLTSVERAYVHLDYEWTHAPEHKVIVGV